MANFLYKFYASHEIMWETEYLDETVMETWNETK